MNTYVFVYGSLKRGFHNHHFLAESKFLGDGITYRAEWKMYSLGSYPAVVPGDQEIIGEVYEVDDKTLADLDRLEGHPDFYTRTKTKVISNCGCMEYDCYIYILRDISILRTKNIVKEGIWL